MVTEISPSFPQKILLGFGQILLWGGSYFLLSVLAKPISEETGWSGELIYGGLSMALMVSGFSIPIIGKWINSSSRNFALESSGLIIAAGLLVMGYSYNIYSFLTGWIIIGLGMGLGQYDALFASIGKTFKRSTSKTIVQVTLISSLAPTFAWLFTGYLLDNFGWRQTCFVYAAILALSIYPIHYFIFKGKTNKKKFFSTQVQSASKGNKSPIPSKKIYYLLLLNFTLGATITTAIVVYLIEILVAKDISTVKVLGIVAFLGPSQAGVRVLDLILPSREPIQMAVVSSLAMLLGISLLFCSAEFAIPAVMLFGMGNGLRSILRGTLPLSIFGEIDYALLIGRLGRWPMIAQAVMPFVGGLIIHRFGSTAFLFCFSLLAFASVILFLILWWCTDVNISREKVL
jgi:MFS family permease